MNELVGFTPQADFTNMEYYEDGVNIEDEQYPEGSDYERELLLAMEETPDELYILANEADYEMEDPNYLRMKNNIQLSDYPLAA